MGVDVFVKLLTECTEYPIKLAEKIAETFPTKLSEVRRLPKLIVRVLFLNALVLTFGIASALFESLIVKLIPFLSFLHFPVVAVAVFTAAFYIEIKRWQKKKYAKLEHEIRQMRVQYTNDQEGVKEFVEKYNVLLTQALRFGLDEVKDHDLIRSIIELATPGNQELAKRIDRLQEHLGVARRISTLRSPVQKVLVDLLNNDLLEKDWGQLFMTFAVQLQLQPWIKSSEREKFIFIRDYEEVKQLYPGTDLDREEKFHQLLKTDLKSILELVNGNLWSIMYKDVKVWLEADYPLANEDLLQRAREGKSKLCRLFLYERDWIDAADVRNALKTAALWHSTNKYSCRFFELKQSSMTTRALITSEEDFISSCLINETRIMMSQTPSPFATLTKSSDDPSGRTREPPPKRYKYICDVDESLVSAYKTQFQAIWNDNEAMAPDTFLRDILKEPNPSDPTGKV